MDAFGKERLMNLSQVEQTMSTGVDEEGKEVKGQKLVALLHVVDCKETSAKALLTNW